MTPFSELYQIDCPFYFHNMFRFGIRKEDLEAMQLPVAAYYFSPSSGEQIGISLDYFTAFTRNQLQVFNHWLFAFGFFGIIADLTLIANGILLIALLSLLGATLTLPGLAGIALTVGMAVDSNVLIYERMKEEKMHGITIPEELYGKLATVNDFIEVYFIDNLFLIHI